MTPTMVQRSRVNVRDVIATRKMFKQLPDAAKAELGDVLDNAGDKLLSAMKADVPVKSGYLRSLLTKRLSRAALVLRVGFIGRKANGKARKVGGKAKTNDQFVGNQFYGRFVEFGRKAKTVRVTRTARRRGRDGKPASPYLMRVRAMAPRPFVFTNRTDLRRALQDKLRDVWSRILSSASGGTE